MNVSDPRFARLWESHEYAIDPTNPRFKGTEGMKKLLEEGRRKRKDAIGGGDDEVLQQDVAAWKKTKGGVALNPPRGQAPLHMPEVDVPDPAPALTPRKD